MLLEDKEERIKLKNAMYPFEKFVSEKVDEEDDDDDEDLDDDDDEDDEDGDDDDMDDDDDEDDDDLEQRNERRKSKGKIKKKSRRKSTSKLKKKKKVLPFKQKSTNPQPKTKSTRMSICPLLKRNEHGAKLRRLTLLDLLKNRKGNKYVESRRNPRSGKHLTLNWKLL